MLVCTFTLVSRVLGQSHIDLGLELITQVAVLQNERTDTTLQQTSSDTGDLHCLYLRVQDTHIFLLYTIYR